MQLTLKILDSSGRTLLQKTGDDDIFLVHRADYETGDCLVVETGQAGQFIVLSLDDAMPDALLYLRETEARFAIPFGARRSAYSPKAFTGQLHRLRVRRALPSEITSRRNLAFNPFDDHDSNALFPHARANVETRGESAFAARNAIDGETANDDHGFWPYTSWGINQDPNAALTIEFGRPVRIDEVVLYLRADFPHDAWWERASLSSSDGATIDFALEKTGAAQRFAIEGRVVEWVRLHRLIKADDPSPFPALTLIEVLGQEV